MPLASVGQLTAVLAFFGQVPVNHDDPSMDVAEEQRKIDEADALTEEDQAEKETLLTKVGIGRLSTEPTFLNCNIQVHIGVGRYFRSVIYQLGHSFVDIVHNMGSSSRFFVLHAIVSENFRHRRLLSLPVL